jgi:hypothetical protein
MEDHGVFLQVHPKPFGSLAIGKALVVHDGFATLACRQYFDDRMRL